MKKRLAILPLLLFSVASCAGRGNDVAISTDKTQLYVGVYTGELESGSLAEIAERFEKKYADYSFEKGKTGVQVVFTDGRFDDSLKDTILDGQEEVFLDTAASSLYLSNLGLLLDLSELYLSPMNYDLVRKTAGESNSQTSTFYNLVRADRRDLYRGIENHDAFYGVPGFSQYPCIVYDVDLFEEKNLYFKEGGGFVSSPSDSKSKGPDGKAGTKDDGLPATYDDFFTLCDKIVSLDMTPIMWGGTVQEYVSSLLTALATDNDGKQEAELNYNYNGTSERLINVSSDGVVTHDQNSTVITAKNGYELYRQEGRYNALRWLKRLLSNKSYYNHLDATSAAFTNKDAQEQFLYSKRSKTRKRTAMLIEGSWWCQEANGTFLAMSAEHAEDGRNNRKLGFLPFPKADESHVGEPLTILERAVGDGFIKANIAEEKKELALSFLQFLFQRDSCATAITLDGQTRAVDFELANEEYGKLDYWSKCMYDLQQDAVTATMYSNSKIMQNYPSDLWYSPNLWRSLVGGTTYTYPTTAMINDGISAAQYFRGGIAYWTPDTWASKFQKV